MKQFLRQMAQPFDPVQSGLGISLWDEKCVQEHAASYHAAVTSSSLPHPEVNELNEDGMDQSET